MGVVGFGLQGEIKSFSLGMLNFKYLLYINGDVKQVVEYKRLKFKSEDRVENINLDIIYIFYLWDWVRKNKFQN